MNNPLRGRVYLVWSVALVYEKNFDFGCGSRVCRGGAAHRVCRTSCGLRPGSAAGRTSARGSSHRTPAGSGARGGRSLARTCLRLDAGLLDLERSLGVEGRVLGSAPASACSIGAWTLGSPWPRLCLGQRLLAVSSVKANDNYFWSLLIVASQCHAKGRLRKTRTSWARP